MSDQGKNRNALVAAIVEDADSLAIWEIFIVYKVWKLATH
jgi:hypothetical protein